jgi:hypothetical protein
MTDLFEPLTPPNGGAPAPRKCLRHDWRTRLSDGLVCCFRCGRIKDDAVSRRGRNNRARGNSIERSVGKQLGLKRVGQYGGPTDVGNAAEPFRVSVKSGSGYFSERYWDQLKRQTVTASQTALLVVTDAPGPGHRRRAMVVLDLADWLSLHGSSGVEDVA